ncbi:MAG: polysaccharide biosynthesis tyrosine autokinase [Abditibacteriales bacterium]|nr:polysaccharide biosynthesis tyrosine autokinase [Abditibacteriales bacterium]MDW8367369.1 polysaccharide biosynthesis tyrosine autokinase [Abditibacteriales bacterium]
MEQSGRTRDLRQYMQVVQQRWKLVAFIVIIGIVGGTVVVFQLPPVYEASSLVVLQQPQSPGTLDRIPMLAASSGQGMAVQTAANLVRSNVVASQVARRLNAKLAARSPSFASPLSEGGMEGSMRLPLTHLDVLKALSAEGVQPDQVFIRARSTHRHLAVLIANEAANVFIEERERETRGQVSERYNAVVERLNELDKEVRRLDEKVAKFLRDAGMFSEEDFKERLRAFFELRRVREESAAAMEAANAELGKLMQQLKKEGKIQYFKVRQEDPALRGLQEKVDQLEIDYIKAQAAYQPDADEVLNLKDQLDAARKQVEAYRKKRQIEVMQAEVNPAYAELMKAASEAQAQFLLAQARYQRFSAAYAEELRRLSNLPGQFQQLSDLRRQVEALLQMRALLLSRKLDAEIEKNAPPKRATLGDRALVGKVVAPRKPQLLLGVVALSLALGVGAALMSHWTDTRIHTLEDLAKSAGVAPLGFIPDMGRCDGAQQLITFHQPRSPVSEAYRALRSTLRYATMDRPVRTLLVTSATEGEGKTVTAANLAVSVADTGKRVVLVDADLRRPSQHVLFERERTAGLTTVLAGDLELSAVLLRTDVENLLLLPAGPTPPNPSELLESPQMEAVLQQLVERSDMVIVDVPPVLAVMDACALTTKVDAVMLVVRAGKVTSDLITQAVQILQHARGHLVGAVLNRVKVTRRSPYHHYYAYAEGTRRQRVRQRR